MRNRLKEDAVTRFELVVFRTNLFESTNLDILDWVEEEIRKEIRKERPDLTIERLENSVWAGGIVIFRQDLYWKVLSHLVDQGWEPFAVANESLYMRRRVED